MFSDEISFISSINTIKAGLDLVQAGNNMGYVIERIYKISSPEQMYAVKDQLVGKNNKQRE
jgi:hypothetical protein